MTEESRMTLYRQGLSDKLIAEKLGVSYNTIALWRHRRGLGRKNRRTNKPSVEPYIPFRRVDMSTSAELAEFKQLLRDWAQVD